MIPVEDIIAAVVEGAADAVHDIIGTGTSEGAEKGWDTRGRGRLQPPTKPLQKGQSTEDAWKHNGEWDKDREAWHRNFVENYLNNKHPMDVPPEATIMGGGTAVGKTTLSRKIVGDNSNIVRVDADEIKLAIPEYAGLKESNPEQAASLVHEESSYLAKSILAEGAARGLNLTYDATSSGEGAVRMVQKLASEGYNVHVLFADVPIEVARQRAASRSEDPANIAGFGRVINDDLMTNSHAMSAKNFLRLKDMPEANSAHLFDTTGRTPGMVYGRSGKSNGIVYDDAKWGTYMKKAGVQDIKSAAKTKKLKPGQYFGVDNDIFKTEGDVVEFSKLLNKAKIDRIEREKDGN